MEAYKCHLCTQLFDSAKTKELHRVVHTYDLWKVGRQTGLVRMSPGEAPKPEVGETAHRISTGNTSTSCLRGGDLYDLGMRMHKGVWFTGLTPPQRKLVAKLLAELKSTPAPEAS